MKIDEIKKIVKNKKVIFGAEPEALHEIWVDLDKKEITFSSDNEDYLNSNNVEEIIEKLYKEFGLHSFSISVHRHKGELHDKNIIINVQNDLSKDIPKIIFYIMNNFFKKIKWKYILN